MMRNVLIAFVVIGLGVISFLAYKNPQLFQAALTGGTTKTVTTHLYIPSDYKAPAGEQGAVEVMAGKAMGDVTVIDLTLSFDKSKVSLLSVEGGSSLTSGSYTLVTPSASEGKFRFTLTLSSATDFSVNDKLAKIYVSLASGLSSGDKVSLIKDSLTITAADPAITTATYTAGQITVGTGSSDLCKNIDCGKHGTCNPVDGKCVCDKGYDIAYLCNACSAGYSGYPDCKVSTVGDVKGIILTLDDETLGKLDTAELDKAWTSAYMMINSTKAAGALIALESEPVAKIVPTCTDAAALTEKAKVECMVDDPNGDGTTTDGLASILEAVPGVNVTTYPTVPGLIKLTAGTGNADNSMEGITSSSGEVLVLAGMDYTIKLHPTSSYQTRVVGKNGSDSDVTYLDLKFDDVKWMPQPTDRLKKSSLSGGLLERGDKTGQTPLYVALSMTDGSTLDSINKLTIDVPSAPIIEYMRRIGSKPIEKGGRINLSVKIYDAEKITDIKDIRTSIVRTTGTTLTAINNDSSAVWFTATPYMSEVTVTDSGTQTSTKTTTAPGTSTTTTKSTSTALNYKIYSIPIDVPQDANMTDGSYKLLLEITDTDSRVTAGIMDITIGAVATGDVDGSGSVNMLDVIKAFQIANGATATQTEVQAADLNNDGKVTMLDVITLFNQLNT
jgi:hypothetical protein